MLKVLAGWWRAGRFSLRIVGVVAGATALILVLWWVPRYQVAHTPGVTGEKRFESEDEARKTLAQMLGGAVVLLGLYFSAKTFGLSREGQLTDRYTKAIEQLGKSDAGQPNIEVRLGAIYALERIAIDSPRDHWTIMEVLTAYVRRNAPLEPEREFKSGERPRTELQAILTVLGRRRTDEGREKPGHKLDLSRSCLWNADFSNGNFQSLVLSMADLRGALFAEADLRSARLFSADVRQAYFWKADLRSAKCFLADFRHARMPMANLCEAELTGSRFEGAILAKVDLLNSEIERVKFSGAIELTADQVRRAKGWQEATYSPDLREELGLTEPDGANDESGLPGDDS